MDTPVVSLVAVDNPTQSPDEFLHYRRARTRLYALAGLAISGWMGFFVLAAVLLTAKPGGTVGPDTVAGDLRPAQQAALEPKAAAPEVTAPEVTAPEVTALVLGPEQGRAPSPQPVSILTTYEERRRIQERVMQWDAADYQDGNVGAARQVYEYAVSKGWAPAALALAFTYDPFELQRRGVAIAPDAAKARACYIKARELMTAAVAFYLSRLERGRDDKC
jgi:hypothetical protein